MDNKMNITKDLRISSSCVEFVTGTQYACLVPAAWLSALCCQNYTELSPSDFSTVSELDPKHLLAQSTIKIPAQWKRVSVQVLEKSDAIVQSLVECLLTVSERQATQCEILQHGTDQIHRGLWRAACKQYPHSIWPTKQEISKLPQRTQTALVHDVIGRLFRCPIIKIPPHGTAKTTSPRSSQRGIFEQQNPGLLNPIVALESRSSFYLVFPFEQFTLWNCVSFSPNKLGESTAKALFVYYQILQCVRHYHSQGVSVGNIHLNDFFIDERCWLRLSHPAISSRLFTPKNSQFDVPSVNVPKVALLDLDLADLVQAWMLGQVSNFDYLMALNKLAGRRMCDPNHHPILPWVTDFKSPSSGFRDLTRSKYRLNKGDSQLDVTYNPEDPLKDPLQVPHHIAEVLSDITYYVYKSRRIPKSVLTSHVRQRWVPHEYPASMERLQEWTPDECIPEFFTDPSIFQSIHDDLPDLEIPSWAKSPEDFIQKHREILESDQVSHRLHHWIDLTFGYKLTGASAVKAKNVSLQLVDHHTNLLSYGVVQLFNHPHPPKVVQTHTAKILGQSQDSFQLRTGNLISTDSSVDDGSLMKTRGECRIALPPSFQPLLALNHLEALYEFCERVAGKLPRQPDNTMTVSPSIDEELLAQDMQVVGCLLIELFLSPYCRALGYDASLVQRYQLVRGVCSSNWQELPRSVRAVSDLLLQLKKTWSPQDQRPLGSLFMYEPVSPNGLPPPNIDHLLHPTCSTVNFPAYFKSLYLVLSKLHRLEAQEQAVQLSNDDTVRISRTLKRLSKQRIAILAHYIYKVGRQLREEGLQILLPYAKEMISNPLTSVHATWCLFNPFAQVLSRDDSEKHFLQLLQKLFDEENTTPKFIKIYHRSFVMQLIIRLGLECVLNNIVTYIIEGVGGYKDYTDEGVARQISHDTKILLKGQGQNLTENKGEMCVEPVEEALAYAFEEFDEAESETNALEDVFDDQLMLLDASDTVKTEPDGDTHSCSSNEASDDRLGKSVGRMSVHSVSRLMSGGVDGEDNQIAEGEVIAADVLEDTARSDVLMNPENFTASSPVRSVVRSETDDFTSTITPSQDFNISNVSAETIKWLAHRIGPVLTAKYLSRNLLRMLMLCYMGREQLLVVEKVGPVLGASDRYLVGDAHAHEVLECLSFITVLYGEQVILLQYFQHVRELIQSASKRMSIRAEAGLISCLSLLVHSLPYLSDATLMSVLQDTIFGDILLQIMKLVSSTFISFPSGSSSRSALCYKIVDILYIVSRRIGFEMTRQHMTYVLQKFFAAFNRIYEDPSKMTSPQDAEDKSDMAGGENAQGADVSVDDRPLYCEVKLNASTQEYSIGTLVCNNSQKHRRQGSLQHMLSPTTIDDPEESIEEKTKDFILQELRETFTAALAHTAYIPFCKLAGGIYLEQNLINEELIRNLCMIHDQTLSRQQHKHDTIGARQTRTQDHDSSMSDVDAGSVSGSFGRNVSYTGNKIVIEDDAVDTDLGNQSAKRPKPDITEDLLRSPDMKNHTHRHMKGDWLAYWEHEVGLSDRETTFNFKQIKLQTFIGHTSSVRAIYVLDNENSFVTASKDKTVKLWSLRNAGDGSERESARWTYKGHRKSVFSVTFMEATRHVVSCDTSIHIWDPFMERTLAVMEPAKNNPVTAMTCLPAPSSLVLVAGSDSKLKFLDGRSGRYSHEYKSTINPAGLVRCISVNNTGYTVALGYSSGVISTLDIRTGLLISSWKGHEGEILQTKFLQNKLVTSCFDQTMSVWQLNGDKICSLKGISEPVHCMNFYRDSLVSATTANKISVHAKLDKNAQVMTSKLRNDVFRGVLTTMAILPLNKLLLLGADNGEIRLLA